MLRKIAFVLVGSTLLLCLLHYRWSLSLRVVEAQIRHDFPGVLSLSTDSLAAMLARGELVVLLDVRTAEEFAVSHLPGAVRISPDATVQQALEAAGTGPVVLYCSVGYRSSALAERLAAHTSYPVYNLAGSLFRWAHEGRPLVGPGGLPAGTVHPYNRTWGLLLKPSLRAEVA